MNPLSADSVFIYGYYMTSALFLSSILSPFDCLLLDKFSSMLIPQPSFEVKPFFEEESILILVSMLRLTINTHLAFFFDSLSVIARSHMPLEVVEFAVA
jgi:hypothetical protein